MPAFTHRFYTRDDEPYGFGCGQNALMDTRFLNIMAKTEIVSAMKHSSPAWALPSNAFIQPLDLNPDAPNYYDSDNLTKDKIFPLGANGNIQINELMLEKHEQALKDHFFYDVFLAFQGITKQMSVPEVMQKANEKMSMLGPAAGGFSLVLGNVWNILLDKAFRAGRLPKMPDELRADPNYEIDITSALMLAQKSQDLRALQNALAIGKEVAEFDPSVIHKVDGFQAMDSIWKYSGADPAICRDTDEAKQRVAAQAEQQAQEQQLIQAQQGANIAKTAGEVQQMQQAQ
jgi:hypothetical protein